MCLNKAFPKRFALNPEKRTARGEDVWLSNVAVELYYERNKKIEMSVGCPDFKLE